MRHPVLRASVFALVVSTSIAADAETLADAIALAYRSNPSIESSRYDVRAADEGVVQALSELRPTADVEVTGGYDRTVYGRTTAAANPFSPADFGRNSDQAQLSVTQPLYTGGRATADRAAAEAGVRSAREVLRGTEGDLLLGVITADVDVRRYQAALQVWQDSVAELEKITAEIGARRIAGELTRTDVAQANSQLSLARQQVVATDQALEAARTDYATLVGRNPGALMPEPPLPQRPGDVETAFDLAEKLNPELAQARYTEIGSREQIRVARSEGRPTLGLRGSATLNGKAVPYRFRDQDQGFAGSVVLTMPISEGGRTASLIRQAEDRNGSDRFKIEAARREVDRDVADAWNQMASAEREARLQEEQRGFAATQLDGMLNEYRTGLRSTFDVLYAQQTLRDTEIALLASQRDRYVSEATLLRRTGLLEARAIMTGVQLYDPSQNTRSVGHKNALPWDGAIAKIDAVAVPKAHQRTLDQPGLPVASPSIVVPAGVGDATSLSRTIPTDPIPGTIGRPVSTSSRKLH